MNADAELARSRRQAEQLVVAADAELARAKRQAEQTVLTAEAESKKQVLAGKGEGQKAMQVGLADGSVRGVSPGVSGTTWWAAMTPNGGETLGPDW